MSTDLGKMYYVINVTGGCDGGRVVRVFCGESGYKAACERAHKEALEHPEHVYDVASAMERYINVVPLTPPPPVEVKRFERG